MDHVVSFLFLFAWLGAWVLIHVQYLSKPLWYVFSNRQALQRNWKRLLLLISLLLFPIAWINFAHHDEIGDYKKLRSEYVDRNTSGEMLSFYEWAIQEFPENPRVNLDYIIYHKQWHLYSDLEDLAVFYAKTLDADSTKDQIKELAVLAYDITGLDEFAFSFPLHVEDTTTSLYHFAKGAEYHLLEQHKKAQYEYLIALEDPSMNDLVMFRLDRLMIQEFTDEEIREMAYHPEVFKLLSFNEKSKIYIEDGAWGWYFYSAIYRDFLSADLSGYLSVIIAVLIWLLFITKILFIHRDKWRIIVGLFALGTFLPIFVYVLGDLLDFLYDWLDIQWNVYHFWYNFINIGMVEEGVKLSSWFLIYLIFKKRFQRPIHFMLLPIVSALGFAFTENLIYVNSQDYELVFVRSTICVVTHVACSATIGYALYRGRLQTSAWRTALFFVIGFLLASLLHGLYDYFLFINYPVLNLLVFLIAMHLFILFMNNTLNFSNITDKNATRSLRSAGTFLMVGFLLIFLCQYYIIGMDYSSFDANNVLKTNAIFVIVSMIYLVSMFSKIKLRPNVLYKFSFADVFGQFLTTSKGDYEDSVDYTGLHFRFFAPKDNAFVGKQFPVVATAIRRIEIQGDDDWWLMTFEKPILVGNCHPSFAIAKSKNKDEELFMDKVELLVLMIPDYNSFIAREEHHSSEFYYIGKVYSRPVDTTLLHS